MNELTSKMNLLISKFIDPNQQQQQTTAAAPQQPAAGNTAQQQLGNSPTATATGGPAKPKLKYKNWCGQVEKKANQVVVAMPTLDTLNAHEEKRREKAVASLVKVNVMLAELVALLEIVTYKPTSKSTSFDMPPLHAGGDDTLVSPVGSPSTSSPLGSPPAQSPLQAQARVAPDGASGGLISTIIGIKEASSNSGANSPKATRLVTAAARDSMLAVWGALITFLERHYASERDLSLFFKTVLLIVKRKEFDTALSPQQDPLTYKPWASDILTRYRTKLYRTFTFVGTIVSSTPFLTIMISHFCARFIAVAFFRVPKVAKLLLDALTPPETEIKDIITYFPCPHTLQHLAVIGERPDKLPFHSQLMQVDATERDLETVPPGWVDNIARKENLFFIFFKEWITIVKSVMGETVDIKTVPGFFTITYALLHEIKTRDQAPPPQQAKPTPSLDAHFALIKACNGDSIVLDALIKIIFLKTCVFDLVMVASTLGIVEAWIREFGPLPDTFDINFFCEGIDNIIAADHHQVVIRALNLIYNTSDMFQGHIRAILYGELLLHKYFYQLFLHWDQPMVRIKRSSLYQSGFTIGEFSKLTHNNTVMSKNALSPTRYPEKDEKSDHSYNSSSRLAASAMQKPRITSSPLLTASQPIPSLRRVPPPVPPRNMTLTLSHGQEEGDDQDGDDQDVASSALNNSDDDHLHSPRSAGAFPPESLDKYSKEFSIDLELFLEIEIYIQKVSDQFRAPELKYHDPRLSNYVAASLSEFKTYIAINNQVGATPPKIIPLMHQGPTPLNFLKD
eukprot:gene6559-7604_t